jgi:hypothetical protein
VVRSSRSLSRRSSQTPVATGSKKYLTANAKDLQSESARFHEFASDEPQEDDWIRREFQSTDRRITINDTLEKENAIRKLGKEAEEEADLEEEEEDEVESPNADNGDDLDDDNAVNGEYEDEMDDEEAFSGYSSDDDRYDGYKSDTEVGFADSDDENEDDGLELWTTTSQIGKLSLSGEVSFRRRPSFGEHHSDSSTYSRRRTGNSRARNVERSERINFRPRTPELPDSTDFVCGTLDEDRPLEEAYISRLAARKQEKHHPIPQDIDPSFPTSEPEHEAEELYKQARSDSDDHVWLHGELEDIHHDQDRAGRRKKKADAHSPKRYHSPPPKRHHPSATKLRGRSPRRLFDRQSPRLCRSPPPPQMVRSPPASPVQNDAGIAFKSLAFRPGLTYAKSLPRATGLFQMKARRPRAGTITKENHVRGAIDIVKGLEQKRQRRREKFYQKYCNRTRREKAHERRPPPGQGAERMREVGLTMAGKIGQGNYVLSV